MKKVCVITGSRAEYGLLRWLMEGINNSSVLELQLIVTGMHLSHEFGLTVSTIEADGFIINRKVEMLLSSDTTVGISKSTGLGIIGFADVYEQLKPDLILILGDRYEILSAAVAAMIACIPIAHIHGGEVTEGQIDESIRHSITKMSHVHFVAAKEYKKRVIQLGEDPRRVYVTGALGIDNITRLNMLSLHELEEVLEFKFQVRNLLITFHPVTLEIDSNNQYMKELLAALSTLNQTGLIFTMPNADTNGRELIEQIKNFCNHRPYAKMYKSLGQSLYFSCMKYVDAVLGNSSSGIIETPSFKKGTINIGDRQHGRLRAKSVIDCRYNCSSIIDAIDKLYSVDFQSNLSNTINPYGDGGASAIIINVLEQLSLDNLLMKKFFNISFDF